MSQVTYHERLRELDPYEFEQFIAEVWTHRGWNTKVSQQSGDQGIDVIATREGPFLEKQLIQVKRYAPDNSVGSREIQQYSSLRHQEPDADSVVVVTTSRFTSQAEQLAEQLNVKLVDGVALSGIISQLGIEELVSKYVGEQEITEGYSDDGYQTEVEVEEKSEISDMSTGEAFFAVVRLLLLVGLFGYFLFFLTTNFLI